MFADGQEINQTMNQLRDLFAEFEGIKGVTKYGRHALREAVGVECDHVLASALRYSKVPLLEYVVRSLGWTSETGDAYVDVLETQLYMLSWSKEWQPLPFGDVIESLLESVGIVRTAYGFVALNYENVLDAIDKHYAKRFADEFYPEPMRPEDMRDCEECGSTPCTCGDEPVNTTPNCPFGAWNCSICTGVGS